MSSPIIQATISACVLAAASNIVAQCITAFDSYADSTPNLCQTYAPPDWCANHEDSYPSFMLVHFLDWRPVLQFAFFALLNTPPNFLWGQFLESTFPSHTLHPSTTAIRAAASGDEKSLDDSEKSHTILEPQLSIPNTAVKFFLDQTVGATINTLLFSFAMAAFRGEDWISATQVARREFWPLMFAGWKLWPLVSLCNFVFLKTVRMRSLVGSLAGFGWSVYLSLITPRPGMRRSELLKEATGTGFGK